EPFGRVLVEAMLSGTPVIATRGGGTPEIIRDDSDGVLVEPGDAIALAAAVRRLLGNPAAASAVAASAQATAAVRFSLGRVLEQIEAEIALAQRIHGHRATA